MAEEVPAGQKNQERKRHWPRLMHLCRPNTIKVDIFLTKWYIIDNCYVYLYGNFICQLASRLFGWLFLMPIFMGTSYIALGIVEPSALHRESVRDKAVSITDQAGAEPASGSNR